MIRVWQTGLLLSVQDLGRPGHAALGVSRSGAADRISFRRANRLVGNAVELAGLEITAGGAELGFEVDAEIAISGAPAPARLDGKAIAHETRVSVSAGQRLSLGRPAVGLRSYFAVAGGIAAKKVLGSCSSDTLSGLGPKILARGDTLRIGLHRGWPVAPDSVLPLDAEPRLRLDMGPRADWFSAAAHQCLLDSTFEVSPDCSRVGMRLNGPSLERICGDELPSEGIAHGAIQVTADGQPLIFLADHPTTGGYPCIAVLRPASLARAAQLRPGQTLRFARASQ